MHVSNNVPISMKFDPQNVRRNSPEMLVIISVYIYVCMYVCMFKVYVCVCVLMMNRDKSKINITECVCSVYACIFNEEG